MLDSRKLQSVVIKYYRRFLSLLSQEKYLFFKLVRRWPLELDFLIYIMYIYYTLRVVSIVKRHAQLYVGMHYDILDSALYCHSFYCILSHRHRQYKN